MSGPYPIDRKISEMESTSAFASGDYMEVSKLLAPFMYSSRKIGYRDLLHSLSGDISTLPAVSAIFDEDIFHVAIQDISGSNDFIPYQISAQVLMDYVNVKLEPTFTSISANIDNLYNTTDFLSASIDNLSAVLETQILNLSAEVLTEIGQVSADTITNTIDIADLSGKALGQYRELILMAGAGIPGNTSGSLDITIENLSNLAMSDVYEFDNTAREYI
jgi:hypothetical protein